MTIRFEYAKADTVAPAAGKFYPSAGPNHSNLPTFPYGIKILNTTWSLSGGMDRRRKTAPNNARNAASVSIPLIVTAIMSVW